MLEVERGLPEVEEKLRKKQIEFRRTEIRIHQHVPLFTVIIPPLVFSTSLTVKGVKLPTSRAMDSTLHRLRLNNNSVMIVIGLIVPELLVRGINFRLLPGTVWYYQELPIIRAFNIKTPNHLLYKQTPFAASEGPFQGKI